MATEITADRRTLKGIRERVQSNLEETPGEESLWGVSELNEWVYQATLVVWQNIIMSYEMQFLKVSCISLEQGEPLYGLPFELFKIRLVERIFADGSTPIQRFERYESGNYTGAGGDSSGFVPTYRLFGAQIRIEPTPNNTEENVIALEYVMMPQPQNNDKKELDPCFDQIAITLIILQATILAKGKEEGENAGTTGVGVWVTLFNNQWQLYKETLENRSYGRDMVTPFAGTSDNDGAGRPQGY